MCSVHGTSSTHSLRPRIYDLLIKFHRNVCQYYLHTRLVFPMVRIVPATARFNGANCTQRSLVENPRFVAS